MMHADSAHSANDVRNIFTHKLDTEWKRTAVCGRRYVLIHRLKRWMNERDHEHHPTNAGQLLRAAYSSYNRNRVQPVDSRDIAKCLLIFAILLQNGRGELVHLFKEAGIDDARLPRLSTYDFRLLQGLSRAERMELEDLFERDRWAFCPVEIKSDMKKASIDARSIMPFCKKEGINGKGGTATVFQVLIQEEFIAERLQEKILHSRIEDDELGVCYELALKTYNTEEFYRWETDAFLVLKDQPGMVQCICSYSLTNYGESDKKNVSPYGHHILLEFGELDLDEFFCDSDPPAHPLEIIGFWEEFFKVADALRRLHFSEFKNHDGPQGLLHGWHADIKPDNILRVHGEFKLADFGFAKIQKSREDSRAFLEGGTQTYGAPEFERQARGTRTAVSQAIDIWSFGCVLSVAVTWVVLGFQGVLQYERLRRAAILQLRKRQQLDKSISTPTANDAFHDGKTVLPEVLDWFEYLRYAFRRSDFVCEDILDLVRDSMLLPDPGRRMNSSRLCGKLSRTLLAAQHNLDEQIKGGKVNQIRSTIVDILHDDSNDAQVGSDVGSAMTKLPKAKASRKLFVSSTAGPSNPGMSQYMSAEEKKRRVGKSERLERKPLLKTAHRAVQHSQAFPKVSKHSTESSSNPTIAEDTEITASPDSVANAQEENIPLGEGDVTALPSKTDNATGANGASRMPLPSPQPSPLYPASGFGAIEVPLPPSPSFVAANGNVIGIDLPAGSSPQPALAAATNTEESTPTGGSRDQALPRDQIPILDTFGDQNCGRMRAMCPGLDVFKVGQNLNTGQVGGRLRNFLKKPKKDQFLQDFIKDRDIILVFDNGVSMQSHWAIATYTAETVVRKVASLDEDGLDYVFTTGQNHRFWNVKGDNAGPTIRNAMFGNPPRSAPTNMEHTLSIVFDKYINRGERKQTTLLIFTDGIWEGTKGPTAVEELIQRFSRMAKDRLQKRWFSIEFISFGQTEHAIRHLLYLDDQFWKDYQVADMIDTEPWSGSVDKMILGSFEEDFVESMSNTAGPSTPHRHELPSTPFSRAPTGIETPTRYSFPRR